METIKPSTWMVAAGVIVALAIAELGIRVLEPNLPSPPVWPSVESALKSDQLEGLAENVSVVFLGSSSTEAAVDPEMLKQITPDGVPYNAALPFSSPLSNELWLREVVLKEASPSLVVIGVSPWPVHTTVDSDPLRIGLQAAFDQRARRSATLVPTLVEQKGLLGDWDERATNDQLRESGLWTDLGHQTGYYDRSFDSIAGAFPPFGAPEMSSDNAGALRDVVRMLRDEGVDVVFMIEPARYPGDVSGEMVDRYLDSVTVLAEDLDVPIWDSYPIVWDPALYVDEAHFNREGTVAFTNHVADLLREQLAY